MQKGRSKEVETLVSILMSGVHWDRQNEGLAMNLIWAMSKSNREMSA